MWHCRFHPQPSTCIGFFVAGYILYICVVCIIYMLPAVQSATFCLRVCLCTMFCVCLWVDVIV